MINRIATNMTGSCCLIVTLSKKSHVSRHIVFITACAQNVRLQHELKHIDADANSAFNNRVWRRAALWLSMRRFSSLTYKILVR